MSTDDPNSDAVTGTDTEPTVSPLDSGPGFSAVLTTAFALLRSRPLLFVPFAVASVLGAASTVIRIESPYPVGSTSFPDAGIIRFSLRIVPPLEPAIEFSPAILLGLKPRFLAALVGWQIAIGAATAVAFASCLWWAADDTSGILPPLARIGWLTAYVVVIEVMLFAALYVLNGLPVRTIGLTVVLLLVIAPVPIALFLAPANIVLGGNRPMRASRESLNYAAASPLSILVLMLGFGYVGYVLTGIGTAAPSSTAGVVLGTVSSVTVAGTSHAVVVATLYRLTFQ